MYKPPLVEEISSKGSDQVFDSANGNGTSGIKRGKPRRNISHVSFTENFLFP